MMGLMENRQGQDDESEESKSVRMTGRSPNFMVEV
jgi:hypothetical protein